MIQPPRPSVTVSLALYLAATSVAGPAWRMALRRRALRGREDAARLPERMGHASVPRPPGPLIWLHALGLGEAGAMLSLIRALQQARPDLSVLLTTNTRTGADGLARMGLPAGVIHQYAPVDTKAAVTAFLAHWRPDTFVLAELDLWPRMLRALAARGIPMAMVNARLTDRRFAGRMRLRGLFAPVLGLFRAVLVQDQTSATRMQQLGARQDQVVVAGLLKAAAAPLPAQETDLDALRAALGDRPVWLAAATEAREHATLFSAHKAARAQCPNLLLIVAPRQPTAADAAADESAAVFAAPPARRSLGALPGPDDAVYLADSMGEMGLWYRAAPVAFIGHSLQVPGDPPLSGKNPFEATLLHSAVVHGPCTGNFAESYAALAEAGAAVQITGAADLCRAVVRLTTDSDARSAQTAAADRVMQAAGAALPTSTHAVLALMRP